MLAGPVELVEASLVVELFRRETHKRTAARPAEERIEQQNTCNVSEVVEIEDFRVALPSWPPGFHEQDAEQVNRDEADCTRRDTRAAGAQCIGKYHRCHGQGANVSGGRAAATAVMQTPVDNRL